MTKKKKPSSAHSKDINLSLVSGEENGDILSDEISDILKGFEPKETYDRISLRIPRNLNIKLKKLAALQNRTVTDVVTSVLEKHLPSDSSIETFRKALLKTEKNKSRSIKDEIKDSFEE